MSSYTSCQRFITQIAAMSFQTSIPHKPWQVKWCEVHASVVTEWPPACLLLPREHQTATKENLKWKNSSQLNQYLSYKPHSSFKPTWTLTTILKKMLVLRAHNKDRKSARYNANKGNPKVNRGCPLLTAIRTSAPGPQQTVWKIHLDLPYNILHWGSTIRRVSTVCRSVLVYRACKGTGRNSLLWYVSAISWLLIPWLLESAGHQQPWYWLCNINPFAKPMIPCVVHEIMSSHESKSVEKFRKVSFSGGMVACCGWSPQFPIEHHWLWTVERIIRFSSSLYSCFITIPKVCSLFFLSNKLTWNTFYTKYFVR